MTRSRGPEAWLEAGVHPWRDVAIYGWAFVNSRDRGAMVGIRKEWRW